MKKIIVLLLAASLMGTFCACNDDSATDKEASSVVEESGKTEEVSDDNEVEISEEAENEAEESEAEENVEEPVADEEPEAEEEPEEKNTFLMGVVEDNIYENEFLGVGFEADEGWTFLSEEERLEINGMAEAYVEEDYANLMANATVIYDMNATAPLNSTGVTDNIGINFEKANELQLNMEVAEMYEATIAVIEETYENMGITDFEYEISTAELGGKEMECIYTNISFYNIEMNQALIMIPCNGYIASVSVTSGSMDGIADILDNFYWL